MEDFDIKIGQCAVIHFFVWKAKSLKEIINELRIVCTEDELLSAPTIYWWHKVYQKEKQNFTLQKLSRQLVSQITQFNVDTVSV